MREILFRGKLTYCDEWVYGDFTHDADGDSEIAVRGAICVEAYPVRPETVGQYTGKKDKNGKRIFEGDIVRLTFGQMSEVYNLQEKWTQIDGFVVGTVFVTGRGTFLRPGYGELYIEGEKVDCFKPRVKTIASYRAEIIGNIHDNPELLAKEDDGE